MEKFLRNKLSNGKFENVPQARSKTMSAIRCSGNRTTELRLRLAMMRAKIKGWKVRPRRLPSSPDFYFSHNRVAIFVDGCFWHGCPECGHYPKTRHDYWRAKILRNRERDLKNSIKLKESGIHVIRFWEHELTEDIENCINKIREALAQANVSVPE